MEVWNWHHVEGGLYRCRSGLPFQKSHSNEKHFSVISLQFLLLLKWKTCFFCCSVLVFPCTYYIICIRARKKKFHHILSFIKCTSAENNSLAVICSFVHKFFYAIFMHFWTKFSPFACHKCWRAEISQNDTTTIALTLAPLPAHIWCGTKAHRKRNHFILYYMLWLFSWILL